MDKKSHKERPSTQSMQEQLQRWVWDNASKLSISKKRKKTYEQAASKN